MRRKDQGGARPNPKKVASADWVLTVLRAFRWGDDTLELPELARRTALVKSTIMRLCISLEKFDLIERLDHGRYRLGVEAARIVPVLERRSAHSSERVRTSLTVWAARLNDNRRGAGAVCQR